MQRTDSADSTIQAPPLGSTPHPDSAHATALRSITDQSPTAPAGLDETRITKITGQHDEYEIVYELDRAKAEQITAQTGLRIAFPIGQPSFGGNVREIRQNI